MTQVYKLLNISDLAQAAMKHGAAPKPRVRKKYECQRRATKLTMTDVIAIRAVKRYSGVLKDLAEKYGVSAAYIRAIRCGMFRSKFDFTSVPKKP